MARRHYSNSLRFLAVRIGVVLILATLLVAGCGGDDEQEAPPPARAQDFPQADGRPIADIVAEAGSGPVLAPSGAEFRTGEQRLGFALFSPAREQIADASVAVYVAPSGGGPAQGPFPAKYESLSVKPQFKSRQTAADPDAAGSIYTAELRFDEPGTYDVVGLARQGDRLVAATLPSAGIEVKPAENDPIPAVGTEPPEIHTPTEADAGGNIASIDTRLPPSTMHEADFADVIGKKPVALLFATPQLCQSRVCGPVVDLAEQLKAEAGEDVEFIHMEVFRDNMIDKGIRPQMAAFQLRTEPWLFTFDRSGKVAARIEGAFSERELEQAVAAATG
jgi:hypothetical protein